MYTFEHMGNILKFSGEKKLQEVRSCLEGPYYKKSLSNWGLL